MKLGWVLAAATAMAWTGCGGGGGGSTSSGTPALSIDADANSSPAVDASYFKIPSTTLGASVSGGNVTFSYWNPSASAVTAKLFNNWNDALTSPAATVTLTKGAAGVWTSAAIPVPAQNYYVYNVSGTDLLDPYAKSMAEWVHGGNYGDTVGKGAILDPSVVLPDGGWSPYAGTSFFFDGSKMKAASGATAAYTYSGNRDAIIYEAGIRDLTVDPAVTGFTHAWGTYKALVDMLPHIQKLGVTHVQLLCPLENYFYDQSKIATREMDVSQTYGANYNWGYDPQNYFTPTGMYSATPGSAAARVNELKTLVNEIHKQGMGVILDVVFNHTATNAILGDSTLPGYWYRSSSKNGAGSNDVQTEHKMVRKLVVDSVNYWVNAYHVDGFRFDLMGVLDTQTVKDAYLAATAANPRAVFVGEGWQNYYTGPATDYNGDAVAGSDQAHVSAFNGLNIGMFSDNYRNIFKNGYPSDGATAFLTGAGQAIGSLFVNVAGQPTNFTAPFSTNNVVNYLTCHDNLCYYDVIAFSTKAAKGAAADAVILQRAKVGYAILLTSQGTAFLHAGDEMFRTKETLLSSVGNAKTNGSRTFVDNSYNASDAVNMVAWSRVYAGDPITGGFANYDTTQNGYQLYRYSQGLIALRKSTNAFRLPDASIAANVTLLTPDNPVSSTLAFGYKAVSTDGTGTYFVFHNADASPRTFTLPTSLAAAQLLADGASAGLTPITGSATATLSGNGLTVTVAPLTSAIFKN